MSVSVSTPGVTGGPAVGNSVIQRKKMLPEPAQWAINIGVAIGTAVAAIFAKRAQRQGKTVQTEVLGLEGEPTIRSLILQSHKQLKDHREEVGLMFGAVHTDMEGLSVRLKNVETAVFSNMEARLKRIESISQEAYAFPTLANSMSKLIDALSGRLDRAQANIHSIASAVQVKLLTPEEVEVKKNGGG